MGIQYEGEEPPAATPDEQLAKACFRMLRDDNGGINWQALPLALAVYGEPDDVDQLIRRLVLIKNYRKPTEAPHGDSETLD